MALSEVQRATVVLVYVEGFSYKVAAGILDIPIGTVMSRLAAARKKIAEQTSDFEGEMK
ncbi:MAG: sigma factor-like helix-turn-helix DNA-binding protein [Amylibacter sp.]